MPTAGHLALLVLLGLVSAPSARAAAPAEAVEHGSRERPRVALTFDACPSPDPKAFDRRIARTLVETRTPATLFISGAWARKHPEWARALAEEPLFEIASHGYHHARLLGMPQEKVRADLARAQEALEEVTGRRPVLFRPPYAVHDDGVLAAAGELGLKTIEYDVASGDPDPRISRRKLVDWVVNSTRAGSIVVMHINHPRFQTAAALPEIIARLRGRGFELVTVGKLLAPERPVLLAEAAPPAPSDSPELRLHRLVREAHGRRFQLAARHAVARTPPTAALVASKEDGAPARPLPTAVRHEPQATLGVVARRARQVRGGPFALGEPARERARLPTRPRVEARPLRHRGPTRRAA